MESNYQPTNPPPTNTQNDVEGTENGDAVPEDAKLVYAEILKMQQAKKKSLENIAKHQRKFEEEQKRVQEMKATKATLEKRIVKLQCNLNDEKYQNDTLRKDISKMRTMSKEVGDYYARNERTLQQCSQDKVTTVEKNKKLKQKIKDNLAKFAEASEKKENQVTVMRETVLNQREVYKKNLEMLDNECLEKRQKLELLNNEYENLKQQFSELSDANQSCLSKISDSEKDKQQLENTLQNKQKRSDDLLKQMEEELQAFEQHKEEISNKLDEIKYGVQKKEQENRGVERGLKNQTEYNKNIREKLTIKEKQISDLRLQNDQLEVAHKEKQRQLVTDEQHLRDALASKLQEKQNAEALLSEERKTLNEAVQALKEAKKRNEELMLQIETQENVVAALKMKRDSQHQAIAACEQELSPLSSKLNKLKEELNEWQIKTANHERKMLETIDNKTATIKILISETEQIKNEQLEVEKAFIQEMNSIKLNFDLETEKDTKAFKEKEKQLQEEIDAIEKEVANTRTVQVLLDEELEQLNKYCGSISQQIKDQDSNNLTIFNKPTVEFEQPPALLPPPPAVHASTSLTLPPMGPVKPRDFDELSGSSAEGNVATYQQILEYKRERQRRQQMKLQQKLKAKSVSSSQGKAPGKQLFHVD